MKQKTTIFMNGRSQAVRLPVNFRFDKNDKEVYISKDPETGDIVISKKPGTWDEFFKLLKTIDVPDDFVEDRDNDKPKKRD